MITSDKKSLLKLENVSKSYGKEKVLKNISFTLNSGEVLGLVGPNGAGKSTIMKIVSGLITNYKGKVYLENKNIKEIKSNIKKIGCLIESPGFYQDDTGLENLQFCGKLSGKYSDNQIHELAKRLDIEKALNKRVSKYSLGMKQKLGICMALVGEPQILILDEPTNGLDPSAIPAVREIIKYYAKELKIGVLVSSHILSEIEAICDNVLFIKKGEIVQKERLHDTNKNGYVFETDNPNLLLKCLADKNFEASLVNGKIMAKMDEKDVALFLPYVVSNHIIIHGMYRKEENLEEKYYKIVENNI